MESSGDAVIPVANVYYLLCYAWNEFAPRQLDRIAANSFPDALHLFANQLVAGMRALQKQGFERGYVHRTESTTNPRGRILITESIHAVSKRPTEVSCAVDEMDADVVSNRILKATLARIVAEPSLDTGLRREVASCLKWIPGVGEVELDARLFHTVKLHHNNRLYSFLLNICKFLFESMVAEDRRGVFRFRAAESDEPRMRRIFQKFVRNFYTRRQRTFSVKGDCILWEAAPEFGADVRLLPAMYTDVTLRSRDRTIVIECKYTAKLFQSRFGADKLPAPHLYQLHAYLRNLEIRGGADRSAEGILLYPTLGRALDQVFRIADHRVRVATVDLNQTWQGIDERMLSLLQ